MFSLTARCASVQSGAASLTGDWQSEEPVAQCGRTFGRAAAILRHEGDELLHRPVRCIARVGCARLPRLGSRPRTAHREA